MRLSIFTTVTNPMLRGDTYTEALDCYQRLADEVVIINGGKPMQLFNEFNFVKTKVVDNNWPKEFDWKFIGQQFQRGYDACGGDWVLHCDLDFLFHEKDFKAIRQALVDHSHEPALSFYKYQFILPDRYNLKSRLVIVVNKGAYGDRIRFDSGGDLAQPSLDGKYLSPDDIPESRIALYNYEKLTKTKEQIMDDVGRMERAYQRHFGHTQYGSDGSDQDAYDHWLKAQYGKLQKPQEHISLDKHPKYIQDTIKNLKPNQWGYSAFGYMENDYVS